MFSNFEAEWRKVLAEMDPRIDELERRDLEGATPAEFDLADILDGRKFLVVRGLANFWHAHSGVDFLQHIADLITGAHNQKSAELTFILAGNDRGLSLSMSLGNVEMTETMLKGLLPGIHLDAVPAIDMAFELERHFRIKGIISGIPDRKAMANCGASSQRHEPMQSHEQSPLTTPGDTQELAQFERVIRGMYGAAWGYIVQAQPCSRLVVTNLRQKVIEWQSDVASKTRIQGQRNMQVTDSKAQTLSGELVNFKAQYLTRLLDRQMERLDEALASGQWLVNTYFGASNADDAQRLAGLLMSVLAGKNSRPDPMRAYLHNPRSLDSLGLAKFSTYLSSEEVAHLIQFPREEVPGYAIADFVRFDVDFHLNHTTTAIPMPISLGHIQHNDQDSAPYSIVPSDLTKHAVVVGVTGSGKTTTVMNILDHLIDLKTPFMIIEPAKTEYRALRNRFARRADVRIYTLANENIAPFRLNPFEFETDDTPGSASVVNHIDFLKAVFNAAFILYAPMPYVLEIALHEIYEDKGWDLATGINTRLPRWSERHLHPIFPTLSDLYYKIEDVVTRFKYDPHTEQTVKAGLKARVDSLRLGAKGLMLDTARGVPMQQLLLHPTILEMETIGGDDEKTFLMGLLLAKLYEFRRLQATAGLSPGQLQHLLVFEEAHRLLKNTETQVDTESSNMRAQAIEVFTNMLSEVRAYGQGVLVAEQIPAKLAPDVLKNTNLKVVHRLVAQDDRQSLGQTMNLNAEQMNHLGILSPGMAIVYAEGADHAYKVRLDNYKSGLSALTNAQLKAFSTRYASVEAYQFILDLHSYNIHRTEFGGPDALIYQFAARLLASQKGQWLLSHLLLRTIFSRSKLVQVIEMLKQHIEYVVPSLQANANMQEATVKMVILRGCAEVLHRHGALYGWTYPQVEELRVPLTQGLLTLVQKGELALANSDLDRFARRYEKLLERSQGPFAGCVYCRAKCLYRLETHVLLLHPDREWIDGELQRNHPSRAEQYAAIARASQSIVSNWLGELKNSAISDLAYCAALHAESETDLTEYEQKKFGEFLSTELFK